PDCQCTRGTLYMQRKENAYVPPPSLRRLFAVSSPFLRSCPCGSPQSPAPLHCRSHGASHSSRRSSSLGPATPCTPLVAGGNGLAVQRAVSTHWHRASEPARLLAHLFGEITLALPIYLIHALDEGPHLLGERGRRVQVLAAQHRSQLQQA